MEQLTSYQISEWEAYDVIDPIGHWRDDFQTAALSATITNIVNHLYAKKGIPPKIMHPKDFMPEWGSDGKQKVVKQSLEEMKAALYSIAAAFGNDDKEKRKPLKKKKP